MFPSLPFDWFDTVFAATTAVATFADVANGPPIGCVLFAVFGAGVAAFSPLWAESSESYSSSLLLDDVRK